MIERKSPADMAKENEKPCQVPQGGKCFGSCPDANPMHYTKEHDKIQSRTTGKMMEISIGDVGGGLVPKNPFASLQQARFAHVHPEKFGGEKGLKEWDKSTNFSNIPERKKK